MTRVRLEWDGKSAEVPRLRLPLQVVETVNSPRADRGSLFEANPAGSDDSGWRNRLIWGDNLHVLASLADELAGQVDLVYIDPPFDSRQDYKVRIAVGDGANSADQELTKISSIVEEKAYRDTWGKGVDSYLQMLYQRLILLRELLSERGSLFLHLAPNVSHHARAILDEIFDPENFRAEIIWQRVTAHSDTKDFGTIHDSIVCFSKSEKRIWNPQFRPYDESYIKSHYSHVDESGRKFRLDNLTSPNPRPNMTYAWRGHEPPAFGWRYSVETMTRLHSEGRIWYPKEKSKRPQLKRFLDEMPGMPLGDVWADIFPVNSQAQERLGYDTQKPETLLERIIKSSSDEGSIVLDCFVGSGTTAAVAEKLGRRWVAVDIGRFAIHTTRKRLLDTVGCRPFEVANLGRYERQAWQSATTGEQYRAYLDFVIDLYGATPVEGFTFIHGTQGKRAVHVGAVDAAVSHAQIKDALDEARSAGYHTLDVLGWEWEMGLHELVQDEARAAGVRLSLYRIPREVMDPRNIEAGEITFHELAYVTVETKLRRRTVAVTLANFALSNPELIPASVRSKISNWSDYVDYWAVDFTYGSGGDTDTFRNAWQSFRTYARRTLELTAEHTYDGPGSHTVLVKVVDVFGNDTTTSVAVTVP
ncbi:site-specific DNA-methyltransferase [Protofrankia symbiont of Coriaria ruscifolia]|uniref:DNA methylase N-4/N-6 domain protein n=1 Tax=Candidatus Protofrankia californiensis TaxID=1839754 RepID=A0A1C3NUL4_9ACTN|nr:site-specific DNA-methyltransferase [Protofrankia symbiont of Coriaria ruscifolia]SBW19020.1 DNA methylase N-4/N-6 domain protein [Candidatus Protofrankia californiensis]